MVVRRGNRRPGRDINSRPVVKACGEADVGCLPLPLFQLPREVSRLRCRPRRVLWRHLRVCTAIRGSSGLGAWHLPILSWVPKKAAGFFVAVRLFWGSSGLDIWHPLAHTWVPRPGYCARLGSLSLGCFSCPSQTCLSAFERVPCRGCSCVSRTLCNAFSWVEILRVLTFCGSVVSCS